MNSVPRVLLCDYQTTRKELQDLMLSAVTEAPGSFEFLYDGVLQKNSMDKLDAILTAYSSFSGSHKSRSNTHGGMDPRPDLESQVQTAIANYRQDIPIEDPRLSVENWRSGEQFWNMLKWKALHTFAMVPRADSHASASSNPSNVSKLSEDVRSALDELEASQNEQSTDDDRSIPRIVLLGPEGYGKSTLTEALTGRTGLRSHVSEEESGLTITETQTTYQDNPKMHIVDTPPLSEAVNLVGASDSDLYLQYRKEVAAALREAPVSLLVFVYRLGDERLCVQQYKVAAREIFQNVEKEAKMYEVGPEYVAISVTFHDAASWYTDEEINVRRRGLSSWPNFPPCTRDATKKTQRSLATSSRK